jgi:molybdopterin converting factor small subunit
MIVSVHLFARARDLAGCSRLEVSLASGTTVADLRIRLAEQVPVLAGLLERSALAVNGEFAGNGQQLSPDAEIALLPPVSGG